MVDLVWRKKTTTKRKSCRVPSIRRDEPLGRSPSSFVIPRLKLTKADNRSSLSSERSKNNNSTESQEAKENCFPRSESVYSYIPNSEQYIRTDCKSSPAICSVQNVYILQCSSTISYNSRIVAIRRKKLSGFWINAALANKRRSRITKHLNSAASLIRMNAVVFSWIDKNPLITAGVLDGSTFEFLGSESH